MKQLESSSSENDTGKHNAENIWNIFQNTPDCFLQVEKGNKSILVTGQRFKINNLTLDDKIAINLPIVFRDCTFYSDVPFSFPRLTCNESLTFERCVFSKGINFRGGTFKKEVSLIELKTPCILFSSGTFNNIHIHGQCINEISVEGSKFKSLSIGLHPTGRRRSNEYIKNLNIVAQEDVTGDISIYGKGYESISISGYNKGRTLNFNYINCNILTIRDFKNEGSLNFYSIKPNDLNNKKKFFVIVKSHLNNAHFYRASFSQYDEMVIKDSYITDVFFINCEWGKNVTASEDRLMDYILDISRSSERRITKIEVADIRDAYRQLKISMMKQLDKIQEQYFYSEELNFYRKTLTWGKPWENKFWDKLILLFSKTFSDFGQSFIKPLIWLLIGHSALFAVALKSSSLDSLGPSLSHSSSLRIEHAFENFFIYLSPLRGWDKTLSGFLITIDLLMRIWSSYMIYNLIRASRRFIS